MHIHFVQNQVVLPWVCAAIYRLAGFSITTSRVGSVIMSVIAVVSIYGVTRRWFGHRQAILIGLAVILHPWFCEISRRVRPEIYYTALALAALCCLVGSLDSGSSRTAFLAGLLAGLAGLAHPTGLILSFSIFGAVAIWLWDRITRRTILWAVGAFVVSILPYVLYVLWCIQDPRVSFVEQVLGGPLERSILTGEFVRWKHFLQWPKGAPLAVIMIASWGFAWYRSMPADKIIATVIAIFAISLPFTTVNSTSRYLVAISPLFCALLVRLAWRIMATSAGLPRLWVHCRFITGICIAAIYVAMSCAAISIMFYRLHKANLYDVLDRIASVVNSEARVYGEMIFWMERDRFRYGPFPIKIREGTWKQDIEMVAKHRFDYAVRTAWLWSSSHGVASPPADMPPFRPSYTLDQVCKRFGTKIDEFRDPYFGPVEVYKLNWDSNSNSGNKK